MSLIHAGKIANNYTKVRILLPIDGFTDLQKGSLKEYSVRLLNKCNLVISTKLKM